MGLIHKLAHLVISRSTIRKLAGDTGWAYLCLRGREVKSNWKNRKSRRSSQDAPAKKGKRHRSRRITMYRSSQPKHPPARIQKMNCQNPSRGVLPSLNG